MYIDDEELRGLYKTSSAEHVQAIEAALMQLEKQPQNTAVVKDILRSAHTLKGDSRMLGVADVETLVHQIEECLMPILQGRGSANDKGQAQMTEELSDRLYLGLDTIKQLAHTAVTGEPNDVNMFYVLASLMGDSSAAPAPKLKAFDPLATQTSTVGLFDLDPIVPKSSGLTADGWIEPTEAADLFDLPTVGAIAEIESGVVSASPPIASPATSTLKASFLELAAELFPADDSTLPALDSGAEFNDFTLIAGTENAIDTFDVNTNTEYLTGSIADEFPSIDNSSEYLAGSIADEFRSIDFGKDRPTIDRYGNLLDLGFAEPLEASTDSDLFGSFADTLIPETGTFSTIDASIVDLPEVTPAQAPAAPAPVAKAAPTTEYQIETIRVEAKQLDTLMGQTGEINVINQQIASRLTDLEALIELWDEGSRDYQTIQSFLPQVPAQSPLHQYLSRCDRQWQQMGQLIAKFKKAIDGDSSRLDLVASALDSGVVKLRLLPISTIFNLFPRMVRDLAKTQSKEINFAIDGGDLLLDKRLLEEIKDPLMHILRNAIDHGIEQSAERQQQGKSPTAELTIRVFQSGNKTTIEILDDGRGLDLKRIKAKAIAKGLHTEAELANMSTDAIHSLIFAPSFSTRDRVTELSGRGVGLDIVKTNVERLKGSVTVSSMLNRGCKFTIELSHTIGSSQVMMVEVRDEIYAIPVEFVDRMLLLNKSEIFAIGGTPTTKLDGKTVTVAWLADVLALPAIAPDYPGEVRRTTDSVACLLLQSGQQQLALLVDRIRDRQLVTIEAPHPVLKNVPHLTGTTILGTGEVCLVLNPLDLFTTAAGGRSIAPAVTTDDPAPIAPAAVPTILLVEDSLVIRTQMLRILGSAGYRVTAANDGVEGWEKLQTERFDIVVSDVEMPRWGGLELTKQIRQHYIYQDIPVVLVTTLSQAADRDRGFQAGANAYLTKGDFDQRLLLDTLTRLI
jgi:two-component system, chemotaxis family, sensor kinase CheA